MKTWMLIGTCVLLLATAAQGVIVNGRVWLAGRVNSAGTKISFIAQAPPAVTDSTTADSTMSYVIALVGGIYDIVYSYPGYAEVMLEQQDLTANRELDSLTLMPPLSGELSGIIGPGDFDVVYNLSIGSGEQVTIAPGTRLFFRDRQVLDVHGTLDAIGTEQDSIVFTRRFSTDTLGWFGIQLVSAANLGQMDYCVVEYACRCLVRDSRLAFVHSIFRNHWRGGACSAAILVEDAASLLLDHSVIENNEQDGIAVHNHSHAQIYNSRISNNDRIAAVVEYSVLETVNSDIVGNHQGGIVGNLSNVCATDCRFENNGCYNGGGGIDGYNSIVELERCIFRENHGAAGGGIYGVTSSINARECLFEDNFSDYAGGGAAFDGGFPVMEQCSFINNTSSRWSYFEKSTIAIGYETITRISSCVIMNFDTTAGFLFTQSPNSIITYCDVFGPGSAFAVFDGTPADMPPGIGQLAMTNSNGDSCDVYHNIFLDPQFADTAAGDYHLTAGSPCIDAGDPALEHDPDGTVADMGAFYYPHTVDAADEIGATVRDYRLEQNYPNPFNAQTRISFEVPQSGNATLQVFDLTGRLVQTLTDGMIAAGTHEVNVDASALPSGMYIYRLQAGDVNEAKKMLLLK